MPFVLIGGEGSLRAALERDIQERQLGDCVRLVGFVDGSDVPQLYAASDATVIPSLALECFGIIALESISCGVPALVTPVGALPEIVSRFEPGWIARGNTPAAIAELLARFLNGGVPRHAPAMFRAMLKVEYSLEVAVRRYEAWYSSALAPSGRYGALEKTD